MNDDNTLTCAISENEDPRNRNSVIDNNIEDPASPSLDNCHPNLSNLEALSIPNKVSERIEFKKWSIDRFYPIVLEQSQRVPQQVWLEFCDTVDQVVRLRRRAYAFVFISWAAALALLLFLLSQVKWFLNYEILHVAIAILMILPATFYKCTITTKIRKKLSKELADVSNLYPNLKMTLRDSNDQFRYWYICLEVENMNDIDLHDVEFAENWARDGPSQLTTQNVLQNGRRRLVHQWYIPSLEKDSRHSKKK